jgi:tRNA threonylcarbamoyladenosine biosynthesis protein TsaE
VTSEDSRFFFRSLEPDQTRKAACALARVLPAEGLVLSLSGGLGVGKTQFVKGLAQGLGLDASSVTSPTFAIVNEYRAATGLPLIHMDFYRLESEMALEEVGFLDLLAQRAILAIEWGDRFPHALPADRIDCRIHRPAMPRESTQAMDRSGGLDNEKEESVIAVGGGLEDAEAREQGAVHPAISAENLPREIRVAALGLVSQRTLRAWQSTQPWNDPTGSVTPSASSARD